MLGRTLTDRKMMEDVGVRMCGEVRRDHAQP